MDLIAFIRNGFQMIDALRINSGGQLKHCFLTHHKRQSILYRQQNEVWLKNGFEWLADNRLRRFGTPIRHRKDKHFSITFQQFEARIFYLVHFSFGLIPPYQTNSLSGLIFLFVNSGFLFTLRLNDFGNLRKLIKIAHAKEEWQY